MEILNQLSSQKGDKTEIANRLVAEKCIANPKVLSEIAIGLEDTNKKLQSDCIEVFTLVSEVKPEFIVPYADSILHLFIARKLKLVGKQFILYRSLQRKFLILFFLFYLHCNR